MYLNSVGIQGAKIRRHRTCPSECRNAQDDTYFCAARLYLLQFTQTPTQDSRSYEYPYSTF